MRGKKIENSRLVALLRLYVTWILIFVTQKVVFMIVNNGLADGATVGECLLVLWHGLRLDSVTACYMVLLPAVVMLVSCFWHKIPVRRILSPYYAVAGVVVAVVFVADVVLYLFWGAKLDANDLMYATKPKDMLASLEWWAIVAGVVAIAAVAWHYYRRQRHATPRMVEKTSVWWTLMALPVAALLMVGIRGGVSESTANPSYAYYSKHQFCNHAALNPTFNMMHSLFKAQDIEHEFDIRSEEEVERLIGDAYEQDGRIADTLLTMTRPNIMLIVWESGGSGMVMNDSVGPEIMALAEEGVYFGNCRANNFRTDRGLVSIVAGWPGLPTTSLMKRPDICRRLPSMARRLKEEGYATSMMYGGDIDFTGMRLYFAEAGFDSVKGSEALPKSWYTSAWGVPDHLMLQRELLIPKERPFLSAVLTLSSHEPWDVPMKRLQDEKANAFAYTDSCVGEYVRQLREMPLWDSLLVIILPDHGVAYKGASSTAHPDVSKIPIVWTGGVVRGGKRVDALMSQSDMVATLLAQMGVKSDEFVYSRNVTSPTYGERRQFALHAYKNGANLIEPTGVSRYDCVDRSLLESSDSAATSDSKQAFVEALLQHIYSHTARMAKR